MGKGAAGTIAGSISKLTLGLQEVAEYATV